MDNIELQASEIAMLVWASGISKTLGIMYERLFQIEMDEEDIVDYNNLLSDIKVYSKRLNDLCIKLNPTMRKMKLYEDFLLKNGATYCREDDNVLTAIYGSDIKSLWVNRLMNQLKKVSNTNNINIFVKENNKSCDMSKVIQEVKIKDAISSDFEKAFIYFLDDVISGDDDLYWIRDSFCEIKYKLRFISDDVENDFLYSESDDSIFFSFPLISDLVSASDLKREEVQQVVGQDYCMIAIDNLLEFAHIDTDDAIIPRKALLAYLKAGLSTLFTHPNYDEIVDEFKEQIQHEENEMDYLQGHTDFLIELLDEAEYSKKNCQYLSLVKRK